MEVSLTDAALAWTIRESVAYFGAGEVAKPEGSRHRRAAPYQAYRTSDGDDTLGANTPKLWEGFCRDVIDKPEWIEDPHILACEMVANSEHPVPGPIKSLRLAIKSSEVPLSIRRPAPVLGRTRSRSCRNCGFDPGQVKALIDAGVAADGQLG